MADKLWHEATGTERAALLKATTDSLERTQEARRVRALRNIRLYEGRNLGALSAQSYVDSSAKENDYEDQRVNLIRSLVNYAAALVAGKQRPKAQFCVSDADWSVKRKAHKLERFVEATMLARQGNLHDGYAVGNLSFRDCEVTDCGILKFAADLQDRRVAITRVLPWEILVDPNECRTGQPSNLFHCYPYDRYKLSAQFPKYRDAIMSAKDFDDDDPTGTKFYGKTSLQRQVKVREGWRLATSKDSPGAHSIVVGDVDITGGEKWTRQTFPFEWLLWEPHMLGMFGTSLVDNVRGICSELNKSFARWAKAELLGSNAFIVAQEGTVKDEDLEDNSPFTIVKVDKSATLLPTITVPQTMGAASIQWFSILKGLGFEVSGVGEQGATGSKASGVDSAIGMRTVQDIESARFAIQWQMYERVMSIGAARQILACVREMAEAGGNEVVARLASGGVLSEIRWSDVDIDLPDEAIQVYAVSGLVNTPADRLSLAERLFNAGIISQDSFLRIIQAKDVDSELERGNRQSALIDKLLEKWLDADPSDPGSGYRPPVSMKWLNLEEAIVQVGRACMQAELDDAPDFNVGLLVKFLTDLDAELKKRQEAQAKLAALAAGKGAPPVAPPQGAMAA